MVEMQISFSRLNFDFSIMRLLLLLITSLIFVTSYANETIIKGNIKNFEDKTIRLTAISDYFTNTEVKLATKTIKNGTFQFSTTVEGVVQVKLTIEDKSTQLYIEEGKVYNISLSFDEEWNRNKIYDKELSIAFSFPQTDDVNQLIKKFNGEYADFFEKNAVLLARKQGEKSVEEFVTAVSNKTVYNSNQFVKTYVEYTCAGLKDAAYFSKSNLNAQYLNNRKINYDNKEYVYFFNQFYDNKFKRLILGTKGSELLKLLTLENNTPQAIKLIQSELKNESTIFAELFLITGIYDVYFEGIFNQKSALKILTEVSKNGKSKENKHIASNILTKLSFYGKEVKAPTFELYNHKDELISLSEYNGKYVYLNFWASWNIISVKQMQIIRVLQQRHGDKIAFISINLDDNKADYKAAVYRFKFNWTTLHYGNDFKVKENYQVKTIPSYVLIGPDGTIISNEAIRPDDSGAELFLHNLTK